VAGACSRTTWQQRSWSSDGDEGTGDGEGGTHQTEDGSRDDVHVKNSVTRNELIHFPLID
jgi:hypothetical protein